MYFFPNAAHPLGSAWTLSPEPYHYHTFIDTEARYLGYSVESACMQMPVVPWKHREERAYLLAKVCLKRMLKRIDPLLILVSVSLFPVRHLLYRPILVSPSLRSSVLFTFTHALPSPLVNLRTWSIATFPVIQHLLNTTFTGGFIHQGASPTDPLPQVPGVQNLGLLDRSTFIQAIAKSKVLIGMGNPIISPTFVHPHLVFRFVGLSPSPPVQIQTVRSALFRRSFHQPYQRMGLVQPRRPRSMGHPT